MKQVEHIGYDSITYLTKYIEQNSVNRIFLVTGKSSFQLSGAEDLINKFLRLKNVTRYSDFTQNPMLEDVENGIRLYRKVQPDIVIAIGGGSTIDIAKLINSFAAEDSKPSEIATGGKQIQHRGKPCIAIPTTAGAGSEATHFAVLYIDRTKYSVSHPSLLPDVAIIDPSLTQNLSPRQTAISGVDAFCQAIESYWSVHSTEESKTFASDAMKIIWENLNNAVHCPNDVNREQMAVGAHLAGKAINITKTTAPHAVSYVMTSHFNIPHGQAVCLTLTQFLEFNYNVTNPTINDSRGVEFVKGTIEKVCKLLDCSSVNQAVTEIQNFIKNIGLEKNLEKLGIHRKDFALICDNTNMQRVKNNPRIVAEDDVYKILEKIL